MNLADAFSRRNELSKEIEKWINRLTFAGRDTKKFETKSLENMNEPIIGTMKKFPRNYTIEECRTKILDLIEEDKNLALRISKTNQVAKSKLIDLNGKEIELSIPELLVLRNDIAPKIEKGARAIPKRAKGIEVIEKLDKAVLWREITPNIKHTNEVTNSGINISHEYIDSYRIEEVIDYGLDEREIFDEIDKIHEYLRRIKTALNNANKTELLVI